ncbi:MAG: polysaccharide biosynthesis/export family protein [Candidatus Synoicihabitans palmerolidicus]|nr:polysaccharide biosynthesis/export family protein [Candidatus Synoicihabitans palmerolidicus]
MSPRVLRSSFLVFTFALLSGCLSRTGPQFDPYELPPTVPFASVQTANGPDPELRMEPTEPFELGVGDLIEIEVLEAGGTRRVCRVMPDGLIYYDLLSGFHAEGLTLLELKSALEIELAAHYRSPQVGLILRGVTSKRIWVLGRVNTSGLYALNQPTTVLEALARAGGLFSSRFSGTTEELADLKHSFLVRAGELLPVDCYALLREGDMRQNIYLPSALSKQIYVLGAVTKPRAVGFMDQVTLVSAIASAFDVLPRAHTRRILIVRGRFTNPQVAVVDYEAIRRGKIPDSPLEPGDLVWVPDSPWTNLTDYTKLVLNTFVRTVAANEGARFRRPRRQHRRRQYRQR